MPVLLRSVGYAFATAALCLLIGYPIAYYIARFGGRYKYLLIALIVLPFLVNYLIRVYAWTAILSDEGLVNGVLKDVGLTTDGVRFLNTPFAVIGGLVYGYMAFMILPIYAALDRMDSSLIEAGKDLYAKRWQTFRHVTWPATFQGVLAGSRARLPARRRRLRQRPAARRSRHLHGRQPDPAAVLRRQQLPVRRRADHCADGLPADLHGLLPALRRAGRRGGPGMSATPAPAKRIGRGGSSGAADKPHKDFDRPRFLKVLMAAFVIWTFAPIAIVVLFSFNSGKSLQNFEGFSTQWYSEFFGDAQLRESLFASLEIALVTMVVATILGSLLAFGLVRSRNRLSPVTNVMMLVPLVVPEIVAGVSALLIFTQLGMDLSLTTIMLAHITFSISYVTVIVRGRLAALNKEVEEAAMDLGATQVADAPARRPAGSVAGDSRGRAAHLRAQLRRLRALLLHDRRVRRSRCLCGSTRRSASVSPRRSTRSAR